ncbi:MAG: NfeD family protein [Clostridiales bacterium]|nr:NfeD family protein [Clostridiales bacterium]
MWQVWLIIAILFFILEMMGPGFLLFWVGIAALITMVVSIFVDSIVIQIGIFTISSILLLFCTRSFVKKISKNDTVNTNAYSFIGKKGIVTKEIHPTNGTGQIKVDGEVWSAKSISNDIISEGELITILKIDGVKAVVQKQNENVKL